MEERTVWQERRGLALERIGAIAGEGPAPLWSELFYDTAQLLCRLQRLLESMEDETFDRWSAEEKRRLAGELWRYRPHAESGPERFDRLFRLLRGEFWGLIPTVYRGQEKPLILYAELFLQVYGAVCSLGNSPDALYRELREILYWFYSDNSEIFCMEAARLLFSSDAERARVLAAEQKTPAYLFENGYLPDAEASARAAELDLISDERFAAAFRRRLRRRPIPEGPLYLGMEPGMERLGACCIRILEEEGRVVRLFPEQTVLPLRNPECLRKISVQVQSGEGRGAEEQLFSDSRYRERKLEVWREALRAFPTDGTQWSSLVLAFAKEQTAPSGNFVSGTALRFFRESNEAIRQLLEERIVWEHLSAWTVSAGERERFA